MAITIERGSDIWSKQALLWWPVRRKDLPDTALVNCSNGHQGLIDEHTIHKDGTVEPSVVCTEDNCTWHEFIQLVGWENRWGYAT